MAAAPPGLPTAARPTPAPSPSAPPGKRSARHPPTAVADAMAELGASGVQLATAGLPLLPSLGPLLQVPAAFAERQARGLALALQSGVKSEVAAALNALALLACAPRDAPRREQPLLARDPDLLPALLRLIDEWRDVGFASEAELLLRPRPLGASQACSGFGASETEGLDPADPLRRLRDAQNGREAGPSGERWWMEDGIFNLDEQGRAERQQAAVAASNILRNLSFLPECAPLMAGNWRCLATLFTCMADRETEDEELVTNVVETLVNIAAFVDLRQLSHPPSEVGYDAHSREDLVQEAISGMLDSHVWAWHCGAAEALARMLLNPDNEALLLALGPQVFPRLMELLGSSDPEVQGAAVGALAAYADTSSVCRVQLGQHRWTIRRLLAILKVPHPLSEVCRKAASALESLATEFRNRETFLAHEQQIVELAMCESRCADAMARVLSELTSDGHVRGNTIRNMWGI